MAFIADYLKEDYLICLSSASNQLILIVRVYFALISDLDI